MNTCLDEGMLQAYLDGELTAAQMEACAAHMATCTTCAELAHEAEHEYALFSTAFAPLLNTPTPTERLRARLDQSIGELQAPRFGPEASPSRPRAWWSAFTTSFAFNPRYAGAFATFLLAIALTVILTRLRPTPTQRPTNEMAKAAPAKTADTPDNGAAVVTSTPAPVSNEQPNGAGAEKQKEVQARNVRVNYPVPQRIHKPVATAAVTKPIEAQQIAPLIPEEKHYLTTIATLDAAIKAQGQQALPPTLRAEFERNLAVVDEAIIATRVAARRNPKDADAQEFLRAAYQNKVDLLTTVADQTQYIAARD
jgi:Putative zinc-finger